MSIPFDYLFSLERLGMKFGLENIAALCAALGHPERAFASVVVAGTNGKGSVTAMVETALRAAGHRTARYTSPHLVRLEERFVIDGREVETRGTARRARRRAGGGRVADRAAATLEAPPTFFECTTAVAFELFRRARVEIAVLEVGLGGRLDATNVVTPIATAITSIDFDHQAQLGNTLESIAREKAGIIKPGIPVVCGPLPEAAARVSATSAKRSSAPLIRARDVVQIVPRAMDDTIDVRAGLAIARRRHARARGRHQRDNAAVAVALLDELSRHGHRRS